MVKVCNKYSLPNVTIYNESYTLPNTVEELITLVDSTKSGIDGGDIEGFVIYSQDGQQNFKCVSPNYLMNYHN